MESDAQETHEDLTAGPGDDVPARQDPTLDQGDPGQAEETETLLEEHAEHGMGDLDPREHEGQQKPEEPEAHGVVAALDQPQRREAHGQLTARAHVPQGRHLSPNYLRVYIC